MFKVLLSPGEEEAIVPRAAAAGVSVQRFLVESALAGPVPAVERRAAYRVLEAARLDAHGVAVNINQMARWGNEHRQLPAGLEPAAARFEAAQAVLGAAAEQVVARLSGVVEEPAP